MATNASEHGAIVALVDREVAAMRDGDVDEFAALLSEDAILLAPNVLPKAGAELRRWLADFFQRVQVEWLSFTHDETGASGDLAYHVYSYTWRITPKGPGAPSVSAGKGLHILRRRADGTWRIAREIWNANPAG